MDHQTLAIAVLQFLVSCILQAGVSAALTAVCRRPDKRKPEDQQLQHASKRARRNPQQAQLGTFPYTASASAQRPPARAKSSTAPLPQLPEVVVDQIMRPVADELFNKGDQALCMHLLRRGLISNLDSCLVQACQLGVVQPVRILLAKGAQPAGRHVLAAFAGGKQEIVELVRRDSVQYDVETARTLYLRCKHYPLLRLLPGKGQGADGSTFVRMERWEHKLDLLEDLLEHHILATGKKLHFAVVNNMPKTADALVRHGADINELYNNFTLKSAVEYGHRETVAVLLRHGAVADADILKIAPADLLPLLLSS